MNKLRQMMLFMHIVEAGSMTAAADKLSLSKSVLSQHLKTLEAELGATLLKRTTRRQILTEVGEGFYLHCRDIRSQADRAWDEVLEQQQTPKGRLRVTAPHALMDAVVVPALAQCFAPYPDVNLQFNCQDKLLDLMAEDIDLAVRVGESPDSRYKQKRIGSFIEVLCQSSSAVTKPEKAAYIANHWQEHHIHHDIAGQEQLFIARHRTNTVSQTLGLIQAGAGIGVVPDFLVQGRQDISIIQKLHEVNVYTLHPFETAVPLIVTKAQQAIIKAFGGIYG